MYRDLALRVKVPDVEVAEVHHLENLDDFTLTILSLA